MSRAMFCPTCQAALREHTLLDPNLRGYRCANDDAFYTTLNEQFGGIPTANTIEPPPLNNDMQLLKFWLTDQRARDRLPNQLAILCRRMVELAEDNRHIQPVQSPFAFCPTCGEPLSRFDSADVYTDGGSRAQLSADLDDDHMRTLIEFYTRDDDLIQPYVHPQLRAVLKRFTT
jgi:hypothetical protein